MEFLPSIKFSAQFSGFWGLCPRPHPGSVTVWTPLVTEPTLLSPSETNPWLRPCPQNVIVRWTFSWRLYVLRLNRSRSALSCGGVLSNSETSGLFYHLLFTVFISKFRVSTFNCVMWHKFAKVTCASDFASNFQMCRRLYNGKLIMGIIIKSVKDLSCQGPWLWLTLKAYFWLAIDSLRIICVLRGLLKAATHTGELVGN